MFDALWSNFEVVCDHAHRNGNYIAIEWPRGCSYWKQPAVVNFLSRNNFAIADFDGCMYGLVSTHGQTKGRQLRKPWTIASMRNTFTRLVRKCDGGHEHARTQGAAVERAHTRIDVLLLRLPGRVQAGLNLVSYVALGIGAAFMGYMGLRTLDDSLAFGSVSSSPLQVPLWIPQSLWMAGLVIFALSALWTALRGLLALRHGLENADRVLAPPTVAEEIEEARK